MNNNKKYTGVIISNPIEKETYKRYLLRLSKVENTYSNIDVYLHLQNNIKLECGNEIVVYGKYEEPEVNRNHKGFNYKQYLKSIGVIGIIKAEKIKILNKDKGNFLINNVCKIQKIIEKQIRNKINIKYQDVLLGILLGNDEKIDNELKEDFSNSSLSHILSVSGMHIAYIITIIDYLLNKLKIGNRKIKIITILFLLFFMWLTNNTPSVSRACSMAILGIVAILINQKSDIINNMAISLIITLIKNPFSIFNTGLILSYSATLGIVLLMPIILKSKGKIKSIIIVSVCAQIAILPISIILFQNISLTFIFSNIIISSIIGAIIMLGFIICIPINIPVLQIILNILLCVLIKVSEFFADINISHILVCPPNYIIVILYYVILFFIIYVKKLRRKNV